MIHNNCHLDDNIINNSSYIDYCRTLYNDKWTVEKKLDYIEYMIDFLVNHVTMYFSDSFIEEKLNQISQLLEFELSESQVKKSVLHVLTESYSTGGHTKLLEMFIENTSTYFEKQSVVLLNQQVAIPDTLKSKVQTTGELFVFENDISINKAIKLANIASNYEFIVLHIHQYDIIANLAFGNKSFKRPIFLSNHADHMFWCGVSISDCVLDLSKEGSNFSLDNRGVTKSYVSQIPIKNKTENMTKNEARNYLQLDTKTKIILSIASEYKYGKKDEDILKFINMSMNILDKVKDSIFILIGPSKENPIWLEAYEKSNCRIIPLGLQKRDLLPYYILSSDLYIESFPFSSYTAFLDTAVYKVNILSLKTPIFAIDVKVKNEIDMNSIEELEQKAIEILTKKHSISSIDLSNHFKESWLKNIKKIFENTTSEHNIYTFQSKKINTNYVNYINKIITNSNVSYVYYLKLPIVLRYKLSKGLIKYKLVNGIKQKMKLIRKIFKRGSLL